MRNNQVYEYELIPFERTVYTLGENNLNIFSDAQPNVQRSGTVSGVGDILLPMPGENQQTDFFNSPAGITGLSCATEGSMGELKRITVKFVIHNFHDFENLYQRYFLRPGASIFVDFGWSSESLYDPRDVVYPERNDGKNIETLLYSADGIVTNAAGDMEVFNGYVVNYDSSYNENGSVECSLELLSKNGSLIGANYKKYSSHKKNLVHGLDAMIINYAAKWFGKGFLESDKLYKPEELDAYNNIGLFFAKSTISCYINYRIRR